MPVTRVWTSAAIRNSFTQNARSGNLTVVLFSSDWCAKSQNMEQFLSQPAELPNTTSLKLVTDESPQVAADFHIQQVPTLLLFRSGEEIDRLVVGDDIEAIQRGIRTHAEVIQGQKSKGSKNASTHTNAATAAPAKRGFFSGVSGWFSGLFGKRKREEEPQAPADDGQPNAKRTKTDSDTADAPTSQTTPTFTIQINLSDGKKLYMRNVKPTQRTSDIRAFILASRPEYSKVSFQLMNSPPTFVLDEKKTIEESQLGNCVLIQHVIFK